MTKAHESEDALQSPAEPSSHSNPESAYQLTRDMAGPLCHLMEAREAILEISGADDVTDQTCSALRVIARDMERSLGAIDQRFTDVGAAYLKERGINRKAGPAA